MISGVLSYYRARLRVLGRTEWTDPNWETIPKPQLNKSFHLSLGTIQGVSNNQDNQVIEVPTMIRLPYAPTRKPTQLIDEAVVYADTVIADLLKAGNRLSQTEIKNVTLNTIDFEALADSNDNGVVIRLEFTALVIIGTR